MVAEVGAGALRILAIAFSVATALFIAAASPRPASLTCSAILYCAAGLVFVIVFVVISGLEALRSTDPRDEPLGDADPTEPSDPPADNAAPDPRGVITATETSPALKLAANLLDDPPDNACAWTVGAGAGAPPNAAAAARGDGAGFVAAAGVTTGAGVGAEDASLLEDRAAAGVDTAGGVEAAG